MNDVVTTVLDTLAILLIAAGTAALVFPYLGWGCLLVAGGMVLGGSQVAAGALDGMSLRRRKAKA